MVEVQISGDVKIGGPNPCFIIAEVGQNHQGDIEIAKKLIKAAKVSNLLPRHLIRSIEQNIQSLQRSNNLFTLLSDEQTFSI